MMRSLSLQARVAIASAMAATIVIAAIGVALALFLRVNGSDQLDRVLESASLSLPAGASDQVSLTPSMPAAETTDAVSTEVVNGTSVRTRDIVVDGDPGTYVSVAIPEDPLINAIRRQQVWVAAAAVTAVAAAAGLGWLFAGRAVRPLQRLAAATRMVGDDPAVHRPSVRGAREAEDLSEAIGHMLDRITVAQRRTEEALGSARDFASVSAHELRTPLTSMRTDLEVLAMMRLTGGQREEIVHDLLDTQRQVESTLADLERLALGELADVSDHEDVDLVDLADRCVQESRRMHREVDIVLVAPDRAVVRGFPIGLRLVLDNAITNAVRHGGARQVRVTIGEETTDGHRSVVLLVDDDGIGVPEAERSLVFKRFVRGASTTADGSGLGLALVAQQAALHGGTVTLGDSPLGGARLQLRLPFLQAV